MFMMIFWAINVYLDYLMMYFVASKIGMAERIACAVLMVLHLGLFFGYVVLHIRKNK
jgi:hypothetical protein